MTPKQEAQALIHKIRNDMRGLIFREDINQGDKDENARGIVRYAYKPSSVVHVDVYPLNLTREILESLQRLRNDILDILENETDQGRRAEHTCKAAILNAQVKSRKQWAANR